MLSFPGEDHQVILQAVEELYEFKVTNVLWHDGGDNNINNNNSNNGDNNNINNNNNNNISTSINNNNNNNNSNNGDNNNNMGDERSQQERGGRERGKVSREARVNRLVLIGVDLDRDVLKSHFEGCIETSN